MGDLTEKDWGRIYAFVTLKKQFGDPHFIVLLERNPIEGITAAIQAINAEFPTSPQIVYTPNSDSVWHVARPGGLTNSEIEECRRGRRSATMKPRYAC
jgi:hypothetical protein